MLDTQAAASTSTPEPRRFHPVDAALEVITRPVAAMRAVAAARPWPWALGLTIGIGLLTGLAGLTARAPSTMPDSSAVFPAMQGFVAAMRSPVWILLNGLLLGPLFLVIWTGILYAVGQLAGGRGTFSGLFSALGFASVPNILHAPIAAWLNLAGGGGAGVLSALSGLIGVAFAIWVLVLEALAVRESLNLTTGRAVTVLLIPLTIPVVLGVVVAVVFATLFFGNLWRG